MRTKNNELKRFRKTNIHLFFGMCLAAICFVLLFAGIGVASATDYYVATWGNDSDNGTSLDEPWQHPSYAAQQAQAGATIYLIDGTWYDDRVVFAHSGTADNHITMTAYNGTPILSGINYTGTAINIDYNDYITINNLTITNYEQGIILIGSYVNVSNCEIGNMSSYLIRIDGHAYYSRTGKALHDIYIKNNKIHDTAMTDDLGPNMISIRGAQTDTGDLTSYNICLIDNDIYGKALHQVIDIVSFNPPVYVNVGLEGVIIRGNTIRDLAWGGNGIYTIYGAVYKAIIEDNVIRDFPRSGIKGAFINCTFRNNTIDNVSLGIELVEVPEGPSNYNNTFDSNTIYDTGEGISINGYDHNFTRNYADYRIYYYSNIIKDSLKGIFIAKVSNNGSAVVEFSDNMVFKTELIWSNPPNEVIPPRYYPDKSNASVSDLGGGGSSIRVTTYNMTVLPVSGSATVTVNKFDTSLSKSEILVDFTANTTDGNNVIFTVWDLKPNYNYLIKRDGADFTTVLADTDGYIQFSNSEWSERRFTIEESSTPASTFIVSGYVKYTNGTGIYNANVTNNVTSAEDYTDASGYYVLTGLVNGTYNATASKAGFYSNFTIVTIDGADVENAGITLTELPPDTTPPVISGVQVSSITSNSATITWTTDELANSLVKYGTSSDDYTEYKNNSSYVNSHSIVITELTANTTYYYVVNSTDQAGNSNQSNEYNFKTTTNEYIWLEAEDADTITPDFEIASDTSASNGKYLWIPEGAGWNPRKGEASYNISIDSLDNYVIWGRKIAATGGDNTFFVQIDDGTEYLWTIALSENWQWDAVNHWGSGEEFNPEIDPVLFNLSAGEHTLRIKQREDGTKLDKLLITNNMSYVPIDGIGDTTPPTTTYNITPTPNEAGWNNVTLVVTFFRSDNGGSGIGYTNYSKTSETGPWTTVDIGAAMGPDAGNVTDVSEGRFNVTVSNEGITEIWYYSVDTNTTPNVEQPSKNVTVKIDITPPVIYPNVTASDIIGFSAIITWTTDELANSLVEYGTSSGIYNESEGDASYLTLHSITLTGLTSNKTYYYIVSSTDQAGNVNQSIEHNFTTTEETDLVGEWHFDEGTGEIVGDSSGNGNNGTIHDATWTAGKISSALEFDGQDDYISIPNSPSLNPADEITIIAWFNPGVIPQTGWNKIIAKPYTSYTSPWQQYALTLHDNQFVFELNAGGTKNEIASTETLDPNTWYHVVGTYDGSEMKIYVNAELNGTTPKSGAITEYPTTVHIGAGIYSDAQGEYINGTIDEVKIYNRALSAVEIRTDYEAGLEDTTPPASITNLQNTSGTTWINWTWTNPSDNDFNHTMVYLDGTWKTNTSNSYYNATGLNPDTSYEIGTHTVDTHGNINTTWVNQTTKTEVVSDETPPLSISNLQNTTGTTWINWTWTNPPDADFNHTLVYLDGVRQTNTSNHYYNATRLNPDTSYEIGTHTVDTNGNVNTTWVNQTAKTLALNNLPTAVIDSITPDPAEQETDIVSFTGHGTDTDGSVVAYNWRSSIDGLLSTANSFSKPASELSVGTHTIYFKVQDDDGTWSTEVTEDLTINPEPGNQPPVADPNGPYTGTEGVSITFDGSASSDPDGSIVSYDWDFGDGNTSTGVSPTHIYAQNGTYTVTLTVTDNDGTTDTNTTTATIADIADTEPTADFSATPTSGLAPLTIAFTDTSTSYDGINAWEWDFDNDSFIDSIAQNPTHEYTEEGKYNVSLTVYESDGGSDTITKTDYIIVTVVNQTDYGSISCTITYTCNETGIAEVTVNLTQNGILINSTVTDGYGNYTFTNISSGNYNVTASKIRFWTNSTSVTVNAGASTIINLALWLKGDLNGDGTPAGIGDVAIMESAWAGEIPKDYRYDLNNDGHSAGIGDVTIMKSAWAGEIILE